MTKKEYDRLPIATKLITDGGFEWVKISSDKWVCTESPRAETWNVGDMYTDSGGEHEEKGHTYILPFDLYLTELENGSI